MKKLLLSFVLSIFVMGLVSAGISNFGTFQQNTDIKLLQICSNCTFNNITSVVYPNSTQAIGEMAMTRNGSVYNFTLISNFTDAPGTYTVNGFGDLKGVDTTWVYTFDITITGIKLSQDRAIIYVAMLLLLVFLFFTTIAGVSFLPASNNRNDDGFIVSINSLKYLRAILLVFAWSLLIGINFTASNISGLYLQSDMMSDLFFNFYRMMMLLTLPMIFIWFIWLFYSITQDRQLKRMLERGIEMGGEP
tara:strand:- start:21 stop:764 length:744 start_codon:yes stop_codon:yes gene_type:complete